MTQLLAELLLEGAARNPDSQALAYKDGALSYGALAAEVERFARGLVALGVQRQERVAVFLPKQFETVIAMFGAAHAGCVFVPVNPILKSAQVEHILRDCNVRVLVTSPERLGALEEALERCTDLRHIVLVPGPGQSVSRTKQSTTDWSTVLAGGGSSALHRVIDADMVSILYTSGSTGRPKGVVLSHKNMVTGAHSVAQYLQNTPQDKLLCVLPFSFDYGFSQLSTAFHTGASTVLMEYLFARDILTTGARHKVTGLAGVPPLWSQLADLSWPEPLVNSLRYITNSGGAMPAATLRKLRDSLPRTRPFLMYGLTEAFRSTYLPPEEIDRRPGSMGKAIPNAEIMVVRPDGTPCAPEEPGELVHRGSLVALGYWNDPEKTAERYKPTPGRMPELMTPELAVWSGDTVKMDADGYLYFIGRRDEMIKTSGYRVSPMEVEEVVFSTGLVADAAAVGVPHPTLGQAIVLVATAAPGKASDSDALIDECRKQLPAFMLPLMVQWREELPRNANGKYDRALLSRELKDSFPGKPA